MTSPISDGQREIDIKLFSLYQKQRRKCCKVVCARRRGNFIVTSAVTAIVQEPRGG